MRPVYNQTYVRLIVITDNIDGKLVAQQQSRKLCSTQLAHGKIIAIIAFLPLLVLQGRFPLLRYKGCFAIAVIMHFTGKNLLLHL